MKLKLVLLLTGWIFLSTPVFSQTVTRGEYFFNSYVDFGNGTAYTINQGEIALEVDISSLPFGLNKIYTRVKDNQGKWSHTNQSVFYKYEAQTGVTISEIAYSIDEYKPFDSGISLALEAGEDEYLIDLGGLDNGLHTLFVGARNSNGVWSMMKKSVFYIFNDAPSRIIALNYQFRETNFTSPIYAYEGFEPSTEIVLDQNQFLANAEGLEDGKTYEILLTAINEKGQRSMLYSLSFTYRTIIPINVEGIQSENLSCFASNDGAVTVNATLEGGSLEYSLDNTRFQSDNIFENLAAGEYTVYIRSTDDPANLAQRNVTITGPEDIVLSFVAITAPTCPDTETGSFKVVANGGTGAFTYKLSTQSDFQAADTFTGLAAAAYTVVGKDENGCEKQANVTVEPPTPISISFAAVTGPSCPEDSTGEFRVNATGGAGSFTYKLASQSAFQSENQFTDLPAGDYEVTVRDGNGCEISSTVELTAQNQAPPVPTINIQGTDGISEEVQLISSSALGNQWLRNGEEIPGATGQSLEITQSGNYEVKVTASSGCTATSETTVITSNASGEIRSGNPSMLFPNPATDQVRLKFEREFYLEKVTIINSQGILNNTLDIQRMTDEVTIDVAGLVPGKYFLFVEGVGLQERLNLIKR